MKFNVKSRGYLNAPKHSRVKRRLRIAQYKAKLRLKIAAKSRRNNKYLKYLNQISDETLLHFLAVVPTRNRSPSDDKWRDMFMGVNWPELVAQTNTLQEQIYNYTQRGLDVLTLQNQIISSPICKLLAVRRVAHDSSGKKTAGVDGVKALSHRQKIALASVLVLDGKSSPIKRVWIPKPGSNEQRPLGIPTILDRAKQALYKLAVEPVWEQKFEETSYGFRPGRSAHDASWRLWNTLHRTPRFVLDGDIEKCFDRIDHDYLIKKLNFPPESIFERQTRAWLKAGLLEEGFPNIKPTELGTPQGGVASPLLCNVALHGMMEYTRNEVSRFYGIQAGEKYLKFVRYADDFIVIAVTKAQIETALKAIEKFLQQVGLNIKKAKTRIVCTNNKALCEDGDNSFGFLGLSYKQITVISKHKLTKINRSSATPIKLRIVPLKKAVTKHFASIRETLKHCTSAEQVVNSLSPIIRGWVNYFSKSNARTYRQVGKWNTRLWLMLMNWQKRIYGHRRKLLSLWGTEKGNKWSFYYSTRRTLKSGEVKTTQKFLYTYGKGSYSISAYTPVKGAKSPFDGDYVYWSKRLGSYARAGDFHSKVLKNQKYLCPLCNKQFYFTEEIVYQMDHKIPTSQGGSNQKDNLQAVHIWCHQSKTGLENRKT